MKNQLEGTVVFDGIQVYWSLWNGEQLGNVIAIDTETTLIEDRSTVPDLCLVSVSDGEQHFVLEPNSYQNFWSSTRQMKSTLFSTMSDSTSLSLTSASRLKGTPKHATRCGRQWIAIECMTRCYLPLWFRWPSVIAT